MKTICLIVVSIAILNLVVSAEIKSFMKMKNGFADTCIYITFNGTTLNAQCKNRDGVNQGSRLDLNQCITNDNGALKFRNNGQFGKSCQNCKLNGNDLSCECKDIGGTFRNASINLNEGITNNNANLTCP